MMRARPAFLFLIGIFWCLQSHGAGSYHIEELSTHRLTPMLSTMYQEKDGLVWLDNERIMFRGFLSTAFPERVEQGIYIWDTTRNTVTKYGDETTFCYASGKLFLTEDHRDDPRLKGNTELRYRYGEFGREKAGKCDRNAIFNGGCLGSLNMSCQIVEPQKLLGAESKVLKQLRSEDGFLGVRKSWESLIGKGATHEERLTSSQQPILLVKKLMERPLPIQEAEQIQMAVASYSEYLKKYILLGSVPKNQSPGHLTSWPEGVPQPVYFLSSDGHVETINVPKQTHWTKIFQALPTKTGLAYRGVHGRTGGGLFLYDRNTTSVIDRGDVQALATSFDGCKVAFAIWNDYLKTVQRNLRIKYVNLCMEGK